MFWMVLIGWVLLSALIADHAVSNGKTIWWGVAVFCFGMFALVAYAISLASD